MMNQNSDQSVALEQRPTINATARQIDYSAIGWDELRRIAKRLRVTIYHRTRDQIEADLRGMG